MRKLAGAFLALCAIPAVADGKAPPCNLAAADVAPAGSGCERAWMDDNLKLNDIVAVGTHNSYKSETPDAVMQALRSHSAASAEQIDYRHRPLTEQLDAGARQLEIDVYHDPEGGRFLDPVLPRLAGMTMDPERQAALIKPGFKVFHIPDVDVFSSCTTLKSCLGIVRRWSLAHPDHAPILMMFNAKTDRTAIPGGSDALPFDAAAFDALDHEVRSIFPPESLITPDDVQGEYATLRQAVLNGAWPRLGQARGKVVFALDEGPEKVAIYRGGRQSLEGRVFFVNTDEDSPAAAYITINDPIADAARIRKAVAAGFIVRTRADEGTREARRNDTTRREAALQSGAQYISTDYIWPEARLGSPYRVRLPGNAAVQCNPVRSADRCAGNPIEIVDQQRTQAARQSFAHAKFFV